MAKPRSGIALALVASLAIGITRPAGAAEPEREPEAPVESTPVAGAEPEPAPAPRDPETIRHEKRIEEAERHFIEGRTLYNQGRYLEAAAEFERSFAAIERAETLYNVVLSHELAGQPIPALRAARRYVALPDCVGTDAGMCAKHRDKVVSIQRRLRPQVGELSLDLQRGVKLTEVRVDGRTVPLSDFPLLLMPGRYDVEVRGTGENETRTFILELKAGQPRIIDVAPFVDAAGDPIVGPPPPGGPDPIDLEELRRREERRRKALRGTFYAGLGLTVASGAAAATFGALTLRARRLHEQQMCPPDPEEPTMCSDPEWPDTHEGDPSFLDHRADARRYMPVTNAMIGVTAVLGVATAIVGIFAFSGQGSRRGSQRYGLSPGGLVVRW